MTRPARPRKHTTATGRKRAKEKRWLAFPHKITKGVQTRVPSGTPKLEDEKTNQNWFQKSSPFRRQSRPRPLQHQLDRLHLEPSKLQLHHALPLTLFALTESLHLQRLRPIIVLQQVRLVCPDDLQRIRYCELDARVSAIGFVQTKYDGSFPVC